MITAVIIHFEFLHRQYLASGRDHAGIVVVTRHAPHEIASRIVMLLNTLTASGSAANSSISEHISLPHLFASP